MIFLKVALLGIYIPIHQNYLNKITWIHNIINFIIYFFIFFITLQDIEYNIIDRITYSIILTCLYLFNYHIVINIIKLIRV